jgi:hypothetical protein
MDGFDAVIDSELAREVGRARAGATDDAAADLPAVLTQTAPAARRLGG